MKVTTLTEVFFFLLNHMIQKINEQNKINLPKLGHL